MKESTVTRSRFPSCIAPNEGVRVRGANNDSLTSIHLFYAMPTVNLDRMTLLSFIIPREHRQIANVSLNRVRNIIEMNLFYIFFILMFMFYVSGGDTYL